MRVLRDQGEGPSVQDLAGFTIGAIGGLALGVLLSRTLPRPRSIGGHFREKAQRVVRRFRPAPLRRLAVDQDELDRLEDAVVNAFLGDPVLGERGVDIGAVSHGIIELGGMVWSDEEAELAVRMASAVPGVKTVLVRMRIEHAPPPGMRRALDSDEMEATFIHQEGRVSGMGRRRQSPATDPDRPDDSQRRREEALAMADRAQWVDEDVVPGSPRVTARDRADLARRTSYSADELDNQDPHGRRPGRTLDRPPQELRSSSRVEEEIKPGTEAGLERHDGVGDVESGGEGRDR